MLDVLIDTVEVLTPLERLTMVISDLETYRNMQLLNDLLSKGESLTAHSASTESDFDEAIEMLDEVLGTDYDALARTDERLNTFQLGVLSRLNRIYFQQFLSPDFEPKEEYKEDFERKSEQMQQEINSCQNLQRKRIEQCKEAIRKAKEESLGAERR